MQIRPATLLDAPLLYRWRMDESTRANSHTRGEFTGASHIGWLVERLASDNPIFIGLDINPVGVVTFTRLRSGYWDTGITIAPELRGKGFGRRLLNQGIAMHSGTEYEAQIYRHNNVSIRLFESFGFHLVDESVVLNRYKYKKATS